MQIHTLDTNFEAYLNLIELNYAHEKGYDYFYHDALKAIAYCQNKKDLSVYNFYALHNGKTVGHIALIKDRTLPAHTGFFGFFECIECEKTFNALWTAMQEKAALETIHALTGPINGSTWFTNRVVSIETEEPFFVSEPLSKNYYASLFKKAKPTHTLSYHSAYRSHFEIIIKHTLTSYQESVSQNISIIKVKHIDLDILKQIYTLAQEVFSPNPGYVSISFENFIGLYSTNKISSYMNSLYIIQKEDKLLGFCANIIDNDTLIIKTICVKPDWQKKGLGNALVHKIHVDAKEKGYKKIIYALVRKDNKVKHFPMDDIKVIREYELYNYIKN